MKRETRATRDERERRDGRDGWEHHVKEEPTGDIRSSKFRNPRTFDPDPSPVSPVPPVARSYSEYPWPKTTELRYTPVCLVHLVGLVYLVIWFIGLSS